MMSFLRDHDLRGGRHVQIEICFTKLLDITFLIMDANRAAQSCSSVSIASL